MQNEIVLGDKSDLITRFGEQKQWVLWKLETVEDGKTTKRPYQRNATLASSTDPATWCTYEEARAVAHNFTGIGFVFPLDMTVVGIDFDHCLKDGEIVYEPFKTVFDSLNTFSEVSPSGDGLHSFVMMTEPMQLEAHSHKFEGAYKIEAYAGKRFFTVTEQPYGNAPLMRTVTPTELSTILSGVGYPWKEKAPQLPTTTQTQSISIDDTDLLEKMFSAKNGPQVRALYDGDVSGYGNDDSSADMALCAHLAFWTQKDEAQMERIWLGSHLGKREKTQDRGDYRTRTIRKATEGTSEVYQPRSDSVVHTPHTEGIEPEPKKNKFQLWSSGQILTHDFGEESWVVESLIPKQGMTALSGNPGDFKTWISIHIALCVARGIPVLDKFPVTQGAVLIIDEEDSLRHIQKRLNALGAKDTDQIYYLSQGGIRVDDKEESDAILKIVQEHHIRLLILDSLVRVHGQDENDAKSMAKVFAMLQKILKADASILFTHHHRKQQGFGSSNLGQMMRGSSDILAAVDSHLMLEKKRDEPDRLILKHSKSRQAEALEPSEIRILKENVGEDGKPCPSGFEYAGGYDEKKKKAEEVAMAVVTILSEGMKSRAEIHEMLKEEFGKSAIDEGIKHAERTETIELVPKSELRKEDTRKAFYRLPTTSNEPSGELPASLPLYTDRKQEDAGSGENNGMGIEF
jgi:KaiC/GvpD/RAD55 family RecA-like ATPase